MRIFCTIEELQTHEKIGTRRENVKPAFLKKLCIFYKFNREDHFYQQIGYIPVCDFDEYIFQGNTR